MSAALGPLHLPASVQQHAYPKADELAVALAGRLALLLRRGIVARGSASLLVSGGRTPAAYFEALSQCRLPWNKVVIGLVDERWAPQGSQDRNDELVRRYLLRNRAARAQFCPLIGPGQDLESELAAACRTMAALPRPFDAVVLGMGGDGHTASWFPCAEECVDAMDSEALAEVIAVSPATAPYMRLTATMPVVLDAREIELAIDGEKKRETLAAAARDNSNRLPVSAILRQSKAPVRVFIGP